MRRYQLLGHDLESYTVFRISDVFDGAMITLAMLTLNIFHPGRLLKTLSDDDITLTERLQYRPKGSEDMRTFSPLESSSRV